MLKKSLAVSVIALSLAAASGVVAPAASAGKAPADRVVFLERVEVQTVDLGATGPSVGDLRVTRGIVRATRGGKKIGTYATSQVTVGSGLVGGTEERSVIMEITIGSSDITMTSMYVVPAGAAPIAKVVHPIVGGTGRYLGAKGSLTLVPLNDTTYRAKLKFV
jgi:hypothetical protein